MLTWLSGAAYLGHIGRLHHAFGLGLLEGSVAPDTFNVWVLIWPNQKKILGIVEATADEIASARKVAFVASRTNTLLSIPMLMSMVGYGHGGFII